MNMKETIIKKVLSLCQKSPNIIIVKDYNYFGWYVEKEYELPHIGTMYIWEEIMHKICIEFIGPHKLKVECYPIDGCKGIASPNLICDLAQEECLDIQRALLNCQKLYVEEIKAVFN